jgi:hypothetical protein
MKAVLYQNFSQMQKDLEGILNIET